MTIKKMCAVTTLLLVASSATLAWAGSVEKNFTALDADKDGFISKEEAQKEVNLDAVFDHADANGDGKLDLQEYAAVHSGK